MKDIYAGPKEVKSVETTEVVEFSTEEKYPGTTVRYQMCGERILLEDFEMSNTSGNIVLPNGTRIEDLNKARVIAIGPDVKTVNIGDVVIVVPELGTTIKDGNRKFRQLPENAVIAIDHEFDEVKECSKK